MGHVCQKLGYCNVGQFLEKRCVRSRGLIFSPIIMKLGENVCLDEIHVSDKLTLKVGHVGSKTMTLGEILENLEYTLETAF